MIHLFSSCHDRPVFKTGDVLTTYRCTHCGNVCSTVPHDEDAGKQVYDDEPGQSSYQHVYSDAPVLRVDFNRNREFYLEDFKMMTENTI